MHMRHSMRHSLAARPRPCAKQQHLPGSVCAEKARSGGQWCGVSFSPCPTPCMPHALYTVCFVNSGYQRCCSAAGANQVAARLPVSAPCRWARTTLVTLSLLLCAFGSAAAAALVASRGSGSEGLVVLYWHRPAGLVRGLPLASALGLRSLQPSTLRLVTPHRCQHLLCDALPTNPRWASTFHPAPRPTLRPSHGALTVQLLAVRQIGLIGSAVGPAAHVHANMPQPQHRAPRAPEGNSNRLGCMTEDPPCSPCSEHMAGVQQHGCRTRQGPIPPAATSWTGPCLLPP